MPSARKEEINIPRPAPELLSKEVQEIITNRPSWIVRFGMLLSFLIILSITGVTYFIKYPEIIVVKAKLSSAQLPVAVKASTEGYLGKVLLKENTEVTVGHVIGFIQSASDPEEVIEISSLIDSVQSVLPTIREEQLQALLASNYRHLGELQPAYDVFIHEFRVIQKKLLLRNEKDSRWQGVYGQLVNRIKLALDLWKKKYLLTAPVNGKVHFVNFIYENQALQAGQTVCFVSPADSLIYAEMLIAQINSGKVVQGQPVTFKFEAYPFAEYGSISGQIGFISQVSADSGYLARVELPNELVTSFKKRIPYHNGLIAQGEIVTKETRLLNRFISNIRRD